MYVKIIARQRWDVFWDRMYNKLGLQFELEKSDAIKSVSMTAVR